MIHQQLLTLFFYTAQLAAAREQLQVAQEATRDSSISLPPVPPLTQVKRPHNLAKMNIQSAMGLGNNPAKYRLYRVSTFFIKHAACYKSITDLIYYSMMFEGSQ
jgi:hypothetical protein